MGYLGLDQTEVKDDNMFQRLFWPSDHAGEADSLGKQGFWLCLWIAISSAAVLCFHGHWMFAILVFVFYGLGGLGVREHSQPAAMLVATAYLIELIIGVVYLGQFPGILGLGAAILLIANVRGTYIAAKWAAQDHDAMPERFGETWKDKLVDRMPARVWPLGKFAFYASAVLYVSLTVFGAVVIAMHPAGRQVRQQEVPASKSMEVQLDP